MSKQTRHILKSSHPCPDDHVVVDGSVVSVHAGPADGVRVGGQVHHGASACLLTRFIYCYNMVTQYAQILQMEIFTK